MLKKDDEGFPSGSAKNRAKEFKALLRYINNLAKHKLGYPVSLLTYIGALDNRVLGIEQNSLANVLLNNVGDPFRDSETSLMEVKKHERKLIRMLEKYYGLKIDEARGYVTTGGTEGNFAALWWSKRYLINLAIDELISNDHTIKLQTKEEHDLTVQLAKISLKEYQIRAVHLQKMIDIRNAITTNKNIAQQLLTPTLFYAKGPTHYSIPKIAEILRLNIRPVLPNTDGSMDLDSFKKELILNLGAHPKSSIIVIANIGTTITGAIDDIPNIKKILDEIRPKPTYTIHMDGALTGFVMPILKPFGNVANYFAALGANTLAVSAHKYPGLSQPCGIILAKKDFFDKAFENSERAIEYVGNILDVTITGSRSGLNVLMFYNALCALGFEDDAGPLKEMVKSNLASANYLYSELVKLYGRDQVSYLYHFNISFPKPPIALAKKYQLMLTGESATICVLPNVTKKLVDEFIMDLQTIKEMPMKTAKKTKYAVLTLQDMHLQSTVDLFVKNFCDSEPITKHLGITYEEYQPFATAVVEKAIKDGLSVVAIDKNNNVIAATLAEDITDPFVPDYDRYPKMKPIFAILNELTQPFLKNRQFIKGKIAHVWIAIVDITHRGEELSTLIDMACTDLAMRKGYEFAYAEFTNDISEKITHHYGVTQLCNTIKYDTFKWENQTPYKGLKGEATAYILGIKPTIKLEAFRNCYR